MGSTEAMVVEDTAAYLRRENVYRRLTRLPAGVDGEEPVSDEEEGGGVGKGYISNEFTFWCGTCAYYAHGWRKTAKHGWRCARCSHKAGVPNVAQAAERQRVEQLRAGRS